MLGSKFAPKLPQLHKVQLPSLPQLPNLPNLPNLHDIAHLVSSSSSSRKPATLRVTPNNWITGEIREWYGAHRHTAIDRLELRKEHEGVKHEFIVIYLEGGSMYRIDRRALNGPNTEAVLKGCESEDSIAPVTAEELDLLNTTTDTMVALEFNASKPDLFIIIAICAAMQQNPETKLYHLYHYNCYFHARSVVSIVIRQCLVEHSDALCSNAGVRWDIATQPALSDEEIASTDWGVLRTAVRMAAVTALERLIWPIVQVHSATYEIDEEELRKIVSAVIEDATAKVISDSIKDELLYSLYKEVLGVANSTLWRDNLGQNLSDYKHKGKCEVVAGIIMSELLEAHKKEEGLLEAIGSRVQNALMSQPPTPSSPTQPDPEPKEETPASPIHAPKNLMRSMKMTTHAMTRHISIAQKKIQESPMMASGTLLNKAVGEVANLSPAVFRKYIKQFIPPVEFRKQIDDALVEWRLKDEIVENIINNLLLKSDGDIPESMIRIFVEKEAEQVRTHVALQEHVLRMTRDHSKMVALVVVGSTEEGVYTKLRQKMEDIWKDVQPLSISQSWVREAYMRLTAAVKESIHTVVHDCIYHLHHRAANPQAPAKS